MADNNFLTLCPHCDTYLPARTFRHHREKYYDQTNSRWQRDISVESSSEDEIPDMDTDSFGHDEQDSDQPDIALEDLINHEVWDGAIGNDIDEDFPDNIGAHPSVEVSRAPSSRSFNIACVRCLVIFLAYFWTYFCISDSAMEFLLSGFKKFFEIAALSNNWIAGVALAFPGSLYYFRKEIGFVKDKFTKYVVCPKCHSLYTFENSYRTVGSCNESKKCTFVKFPNHRQRWRRQPCGTTLLKEVTLENGSKRLYPHKVYCYQSIIDTLKTFVKRAHFTQRCELWRNREVRSVGQIMCDVFDGRIWRDFQIYDGFPFLAAREITRSC